MYYVTMLEADGNRLYKGNFENFEQKCHTMYLHRNDAVIGRIFADDKQVEVHANTGVMVFERKEFEKLYIMDKELTAKA